MERGEGEEVHEQDPIVSDYVIMSESKIDL